MNFKATKWIIPYKEINGKFRVNIPGLSWKKNQKGVYLIKDINTNTLFYVGKSGSNLYKTITRHFQSWDDPRQQRFTYYKDSVKIRVVYTNSQKQADILEELLVKKYKPTDNINKFNLFSLKEDPEYLKSIADAEKNAQKIEEAPF